ncbi:MAG: outer membrane lipid asymmetry maintenance protein MlaD [Gammaproteobacteria bacterium]|nr:outer membrane lipid asymmetry maintenance protein MlaD [Gammaproteobacteria bacterium]
MKPQRSLEIGTGLFVSLGFAALFYLTMQLPGSGLTVGNDGGYRVTARFNNIGDLKRGSPVSMAGVPIGRVESVTFDSNNYRAVVTLRIDLQFNRIPDDSDASIQTQGLLGGKYVGIGPGGSETFLKEGSQIEFTQDAIVLESLVSKFFANMVSRGSEGDAAASEGDSKESGQ